MRKIACHQDQGTISVVFNDYKDERQIKDFYKIYKKASGRLLLEYRSEPGLILVETDDAETSLRLKWKEGEGCSLFAEGKDLLALLLAAFKMLRYRYDGYAAYDSLFEGLEQARRIDAAVLETAAAAAEEDARADIGELLALL